MQTYDYTETDKVLVDWQDLILEKKDGHRVSNENGGNSDKVVRT